MSNNKRHSLFCNPTIYHYRLNEPNYATPKPIKHINHPAPPKLSHHNIQIQNDPCIHNILHLPCHQFTCRKIQPHNQPRKVNKSPILSTFPFPVPRAPSVSLLISPYPPSFHHPARENRRPVGLAV